MTDELKKDWRTEMEEQEAKRKEQEAEYERSLKSRHRLDIVLNCLWALTIAFWTVSIYMGVVHLGRRLDECIEGRQTNTEVPTAVQTSTTVPRILTIWPSSSRTASPRAIRARARPGAGFSRTSTA